MRTSKSELIGLIMLGLLAIIGMTNASDDDHGAGDHEEDSFNVQIVDGDSQSTVSTLPGQTSYTQGYSQRDSDDGVPMTILRDDVSFEDAQEEGKLDGEDADTKEHESEEKQSRDAEAGLGRRSKKTRKVEVDASQLDDDFITRAMADNIEAFVGTENTDKKRTDGHSATKSSVTATKRRANAAKSGGRDDAPIAPEKAKDSGSRAPKTPASSVSSRHVRRSRRATQNVHSALPSDVEVSRTLVSTPQGRKQDSGEKVAVVNVQDDRDNARSGDKRGSNNVRSSLLEGDRKRRRRVSGDREDEVSLTSSKRDRRRGERRNRVKEAEQLTFHVATSNEATGEAPKSVEAELMNILGQLAPTSRPSGSPKREAAVAGHSSSQMSVPSIPVPEEDARRDTNEHDGEKASGERRIESMIVGQEIRPSSPSTATKAAPFANESASPRPAPDTEVPRKPQSPLISRSQREQERVTVAGTPCPTFYETPVQNRDNHSTNHGERVRRDERRTSAQLEGEDSRSVRRQLSGLRRTKGSSDLPVLRTLVDTSRTGSESRTISHNSQKRNSARQQGAGSKRAPELLVQSQKPSQGPSEGPIAQHQLDSVLDATIRHQSQRSGLASVLGARSSDSSSDSDSYSSDNDGDHRRLGHDDALLRKVFKDSGRSHKHHSRKSSRRSSDKSGNRIDFGRFDRGFDSRVPVTVFHAREERSLHHSARQGQNRRSERSVPESDDALSNSSSLSDSSDGSSFSSSNSNSSSFSDSDRH